MSVVSAHPYWSSSVGQRGRGYSPCDTGDTIPLSPPQGLQQHRGQHPTPSRGEGALLLLSDTS